MNFRALADFNRGVLATAAGFFVVLLTTALVYLPGLSGPFLLDDFAKLPHMASLGGVTDFTKLVYYINQAWSQTLGRPLSLASFLIDHNTWPAPAQDFKYTNLLLHLLNGCLLFALLLRLLRLHGLPERQVLGLSLFVMAAWLLHPFLVSTTLYVVQRMAMLATTAVFLGLLGYVVARERLPTRPHRALLLMTLSLGLAGGIGFLFKESAALIVPLALVLEATLLPAAGTRMQLFRKWRWIILVLPTVALLCYLAWRGIEGLGGVEHRDFNSLERVLTQARLIMQYLYFWFIPQGASPGLFNYDIEISRGLFTPLSTLFAVIAVVALATAAFLLRRRIPLFAAGVGFFLVGHLLESTTIPLELYFEHRNYLAGALLWLPVGAACLAIPNRRWAAPALMIGIVLILAPLAHFRATTWGNAGLLAVVAVEENPTSQRAIRTAAMTFNNAGLSEEANRILVEGIDRRPDNLALHLHAVVLQCEIDEPEREILDRLRDNARSHDFNLNEFALFKHFVDASTGGGCAQLTPAYAEDIVSMLLDRLPVDDIDTRHHQLHHLFALVDLRADRLCEAFAHFRDSVHAAQLRRSVFKQAALLATLDHHAEALHLLNAAEELREDGPDRWWSLKNSAVDRMLVASLWEKIRADWEAAGRPELRCAPWALH